MTFSRCLDGERSGVDLGIAVALGAVALAAAVASGRIGDVLAAMWVAGRHILATACALASGITAALVDAADLPVLLGAVVFAAVTLATLGATPRNR